MELLLLNFYCFSDGLPGFTQTEALSALGTAAAYAELWKFLMPKFKTDGIYFWSERMQKEFGKSKKHSELQSDRANKRWNPDPVLPRHMPDNGTGSVIGDPLKEKESEKFDFSKPDIQGDEIVFPIDTAAARDLWAVWKKYRWEKYSLRYGMMGEQSDLARLEGKPFDRIKETILQAMAGGWKNLYPEKNETSKKSEAVNSLTTAFAKRHSSKPRG